MISIHWSDNTYRERRAVSTTDKGQLQRQRYAKLTLSWVAHPYALSANQISSMYFGTIVSLIRYFNI